MPDAGCAVYGDIHVTVRDCQTDLSLGCTTQRLVLRVITYTRLTAATSVQTHTHTHTFNGPFSRTTQVRRYQ